MENVNNDIEVKDKILDHAWMLVSKEMNVKSEFIQDDKIKEEEEDLKEEVKSVARESFPVKQQIAHPGDKPYRCT